MCSGTLRARTVALCLQNSVFALTDKESLLSCQKSISGKTHEYVKYKWKKLQTQLSGGVVQMEWVVSMASSLQSGVCVMWQAVWQVDVSFNIRNTTSWTEFHA